MKIKFFQNTVLWKYATLCPLKTLLCKEVQDYIPKVNFPLFNKISNVHSKIASWQLEGHFIRKQFFLSKILSKFYLKVLTLSNKHNLNQGHKDRKNYQYPTYSRQNKENFLSVLPPVNQYFTILTQAVNTLHPELGESLLSLSLILPCYPVLFCRTTPRLTSLKYQCNHSSERPNPFTRTFLLTVWSIKFLPWHLRLSKIWPNYKIYVLTYNKTMCCLLEMYCLFLPPSAWNDCDYRLNR